MKWMTILTLLFSALTSVTAGNNTDLTLLQKARSEAVQNYPKNIYVDHSLVANLNFEPSIVRLDASTQTFSFTAKFEFEWTDAHLDLTRNANITQTPTSPLVSYSSKEIWTPIFAVVNNAHGNVFVQLDTDFPITVRLDGAVKMINVLGIDTVCDVDITRFPFDEQVCGVLIQEYIGSFNITVEDIPDSNGHAEWKVLSTTLSKHPPRPNTHEIMFHLQRESSFYVMGIMFPMVLLSFLNCFVFLLPADCGEKIAFLVAIFVTYAVFLNFINDLIPKSDRMPRLALYLVLVQCHSTLCLLATLFSLNRHHQTDRQQIQSAFKLTQVQPFKEAQSPSVGGVDGNSNTVLKRFSQARISVTFRSVQTVERLLFLIFFVIAALFLILFVI